jgi:hypothetical protein
MVALTGAQPGAQAARARFGIARLDVTTRHIYNEDDPPGGLPATRWRRAPRRPASAGRRRRAHHARRARGRLERENARTAPACAQNGHAIHSAGDRRARGRDRRVAARGGERPGGKLGRARSVAVIARPGIARERSSSDIERVRRSADYRGSSRATRVRRHRARCCSGRGASLSSAESFHARFRWAKRACRDPESARPGLVRPEHAGRRRSRCSFEWEGDAVRRPRPPCGRNGQRPRAPLIAAVGKRARDDAGSGPVSACARTPGRPAW